MEDKKNIWYASWFNTPYYHILYKNRNFNEAGAFIKKLTTFLKLNEGASVLDLACGKGRYSKHLHSLGFNVTGADLSRESIAFAKQFETKGLKFIEHDMRIPLNNNYDAVFNLFTSFGYFENEADNLTTIKAIKNDLKEDGYGVIDFLNVHHVEKNIIPSEIKIVEGIEFKIMRKITKDHIIKTISFKDNGESHVFTEKVSALTLSKFKELFKQANIELIKTFGDYDLGPFNLSTSERLILIFRP